MSKLQSFHTDVDMTMNLMLDVGGQEIATDVKVTGGVDTETNPLLIKADLIINILGVDQELSFYIRMEGNVLKAYPYNGGKLSEPIVLNNNSNSGNQLSVTDLIKLALRLSSYFEDKGTEYIDGTAAKRYDGQIPDEDIDEIMNYLNLHSGGSLHKSSGTLPVSFWIDNNDRIVRLQTDMAVVAQNLADGWLEALLNEYHLTGLNVDLNLRSMDSILTLSEFDSIDDISFPVQ